MEHLNGRKGNPWPEQVPGAGLNLQKQSLALVAQGKCDRVDELVRAAGIYWNDHEPEESVARERFVETCHRDAKPSYSTPPRSRLTRRRRYQVQD